jgi:uncharacterized OsmC-like protein
LGGTGTAPTPAQYALAALASSQAITFAYWSDELGAPIDSLRVEAEGDIDLRAFVGLANGARPGFSAVRTRVTLSGPETVERYEELQRAVDAHCPVLDLFANPVQASTTLTVVRAVP